jgi:hypothetical protein
MHSFFKNCLWNVTLYSPTEAHQCFRAIYYLHLQGWSVSQSSNQQAEHAHSTCYLHLAGCLLGLLFNPEDRDSMFLETSENFYCTTWCQKHFSSQWLVWEHHQLFTYQFWINLLVTDFRIMWIFLIFKMCPIYMSVHSWGVRLFSQYCDQATGWMTRELRFDSWQGKRYFLRHDVLTGSGAHSASFLMSTSGSFSFIHLFTFHGSLHG